MFVEIERIGELIRWKNDKKRKHMVFICFALAIIVNHISMHFLNIVFWYEFIIKTSFFIKNVFSDKNFGIILVQKKTKIIWRKR